MTRQSLCDEGLAQRAAIAWPAPPQRMVQFVNDGSLERLTVALS
nr:hypothetical protein [Rhodovulum sulfidophilum]